MPRIETPGGQSRTAMGRPVGGCYLKCYQKRDLLWFLRNMLVRLRLLLPAIVGLSQGHTGALRIANPPSRVRIPAAPLIALARIGPQDFV